MESEDTEALDILWFETDCQGWKTGLKARPVGFIGFWVFWVKFFKKAQLYGFWGCRGF